MECLHAPQKKKTAFSQTQISDTPSETIHLIEAGAQSCTDKIDQETHVLIDSGADTIAIEKDETSNNLLPVLPISVRKIATVAGTLFSVTGLLAYLGKLRYAGVRRADADWLDELPSTERTIAQSFSGLQDAPTQAAPLQSQSGKGEVWKTSLQMLAAFHSTLGLTSPATTMMAPQQANTVLAERGGQAVPDHMPGHPGTMQTVVDADLAYVARGAREMISAAERDQEIALIRAVKLDELNVFFQYDTESVPVVRSKRAVFDEIDESAIKQRIVAGFSDTAAFPGNMQSELHAVLNGTEALAHYQQGSSHENIAFLKSGIVFLHSLMQQHIDASPPLWNQSFHYYDKAQRLLWEIVQLLPEKLQETHFRPLFELLNGGIWKLSASEAARAALLEAEIKRGDFNDFFLEYTASNYPGWHEKKISGASKVIIHGNDGLQIFTIEQLIGAGHASFIQKQPWVAHFDFDSLAYPDNDLIEFVSMTGKITNGNFLIAPSTRLLEDHYRQMSVAPLYFNKRENLPAVPWNQLSSDSATPAQEQELENVATAVIEQIFQQPQYSSVEISTLAFADALLESNPSMLAGMNVTQLLAADYLYSYRDSYDRIRFDAANIAEIMLRRTKIKNVPIAQRAKVEVLWPVEFSAAVRAFLEEQSNTMEKFVEKLNTSLLIAEKRSAVFSKIPDSKKALEKIACKLFKQEKTPLVKLSTEMTFSYATRQSAMNGKTIPNTTVGFTALDILVGKKRRLEEDPSIGDIRFVLGRKGRPTKEQKNLLNALEKVKTQEVLSEPLEILKNNPTFRNDFNEYLDLLESTLKNGTDNLRRSMFPGASNLILYHKPYVRSLSPHFEVLSLTTSERFSFASIDDMRNQWRNNKTLRERFGMHFPEQTRHELSNLSIMGIKRLEKEQIFDAFMERLIADLNAYIRSHGEASWNTALNWAINYSYVATVPAMGMGALGGAIYGATVVGGLHVLKAEASDNPAEKIELQKDAALAVGAELLTFGALKLVARALNTSVRLYQAAPRLLKTSGNLIGSTQAALSKTAASFSFDLSTVRSLFSGRIKNIVINQAKPAALHKLQNARAVIADPQFREQATIAARAYFGAAYEPASFVRKIEEIERGFAKLKHASIELTSQTGASKSNVASLNVGLFRTAQDGDRFLVVPKENFKAYYKHMGRSNEALGDVLIHEMSHGTSGTMDYVYVGSARYDNGNVNVFELVKLGNKKLTLHEGVISSQLAGGDFDQLLQTSFYRQGNPAALNADSVTQYISFLAKAKSKPTQFTADFNKLKQGLSDLDHLRDADTAAIMLSRARRAADSDGGEHAEAAAAVSQYLFSINDQHALDIYALARLEA